MKNEDLVLLSQIYNVLIQIETHGMGTVKMAQCLNSLQDFIMTKQQEVETNND